MIMNWAASHLVNRKKFQRAKERERCLKAGTEWKRKLLLKNALFLARLPSYWEWKQSISGYLVLTKKFQVGWLKITFLREAEAAFRLDFKFWWGLA